MGHFFFCQNIVFRPSFTQLYLCSKGTLSETSSSRVGTSQGPFELMGHRQTLFIFEQNCDLLAEANNCALFHGYISLDESLQCPKTMNVSWLIH